MPRFEYRLGWEASSMYGFQGYTEWEEWDGYEETAEAVVEALLDSGSISRGLEEVIDACGFGWNVEVREAGEAS